MSSIAIQKGRNEAVKLGFNFTHSELHPNSNGGLTDQYDLPNDLLIDEATIDVLQTIRNYYNLPIEINATARTKRYQNTLPGGATNSQHIIDNDGYFSAIDFDFFGNDQAARKDFAMQVINKTDFFKLLLSLGLSGVGLYDTFIHIDAGNRRNVRPYVLDDFAYSFWDKRTSKGGDFIEGLTLNVNNLISMLNGTQEGDDEIGQDIKLSVKKKPINYLIGLLVVVLLFRYATKQA